MAPFKISIEAKKQIWDTHSQAEGDFAIFLSKCYFHAIEACVSVSKCENMDEFEHFVLKAVVLLDVAGIEEINSLLHIGRQVIKRIVVKLVADELLVEVDDGVIEITKLGRKVVETKVMMKLEKKRHIFHFLDGSNAFLQINNNHRFLIDLQANETPVEWRFDVDSLRRCINQTDGWKKQQQFPTEIFDLITSHGQDLMTDIDVESTLIVDKAQVANCAILVKYTESKPSGLFAYPISLNGRLLGADWLFSLKGEDEILSAFPCITNVPDSEESKVAFMLSGRRYFLKDFDDISVESQKTCTAIKVRNDSDVNWAKFYWQNFQGNVFFDIELGKTIKMNKLMIIGKSDKLRMVKHLYTLNKSCVADDHLKDLATYRSWLSEQVHLADEPIRDLTSLAWDIDNYRLAYDLAELEDIEDAKI
ncbi:MAG: hypothetical protein JEZ07_07360 [Phycisphaerae bacterium]|nr:hypothetical protein [Phycisphaerae bacterium]